MGTRRVRGSVHRGGCGRCRGWFQTRKVTGKGCMGDAKGYGDPSYVWDLRGRRRPSSCRPQSIKGDRKYFVDDTRAGPRSPGRESLDTETSNCSFTSSTGDTPLVLKSRLPRPPLPPEDPQSHREVRHFHANLSLCPLGVTFPRPGPIPPTPDLTCPRTHPSHPGPTLPAPTRPSRIDSAPTPNRPRLGSVPPDPTSPSTRTSVDVYPNTRLSHNLPVFPGTSVTRS